MDEGEKELQVNASTIDELLPGRALDRLIAEKVMGWRENAYHYWAEPDYDNIYHGIVSGSSEDIGSNRHIVWTPSIDASDAVKVIKHLGSCVMNYVLGDGGAMTYIVGFASVIPGGYGQAPLFPLAVCRAALKAVQRKADPRVLSGGYPLPEDWSPRGVSP